MNKKSSRPPKKEPEKPKIGRKRTFSIALRTRPLRSDNDLIDVQIIIKLPNDSNGKKLSTGLKCPKGVLNTKTWEIKHNSIDTEILKTMRENVKRAYLESISNGKRIKYDTLFDSAFGQTQKNRITVIQAIERYLSKEYLSQASDWQEATAIKNQQRVNVLKEFFNDKFKNQEVDFEDLKPSIAEDLVEWAKLKRGNGNDTAIRLVKLLKRVVNYAISNQWTTYNPFLAFRAKHENKEIVALNDAEIQALIDLPLTTATMKQTRDLFVFCVFSCMAYAELKALTYGDFNKFADEILIIMERKKRGHGRMVIPILPDVERILKAYEPTEYNDKTPCFDVPTGQSLNRVIKEIAGMVGIKKVVTWHTARKSGATYLLNQGVPIEIVQKICGHKSVKVTQSHYAVMHDATVMEEIKKMKARNKSV
jgi:integrase/recombinase XerD